MSLDTPLTSSGFNEPSITLKRGKVEIKVNNAPAIVQRMEELFPKTKSRWGYPVMSISKQLSLDHDKNRAMVVAAKNWFKQELYGTNDEDFEILISENNPHPSSLDETKQTTPFEEREEDKPTVMPCAPPSPVIEKTVNKNAYEIRTDILGMALDWVKFKKEVNGQLQNLSDDDVLSAAQKFYKFVENRR